MRTLATTLILLMASIVSMAENGTIKVNGKQIAYKLAPRPGGGFIAASAFAGSVSFVNDQGQIVWQKGLDSVNTYALMDLIVCPDTTIAMAFIRGSSTQGIDYRIVKLNPVGNVLYSKSFDPGSNVSITNHSILKAGNDGSLTFAAIINGKITFVRLNADGTVASANVIPSGATGAATDAEGTADGGLVFVGATPFNGAGPVIAKLTADTLEWTLHYTDNDNPGATSVIVSNDGNYLVCGSFVSSDNSVKGGFILKVSTNGIIMWRKKFLPSGGLTEMSFTHAMEDADGTIVVAGSGYGANHHQRVIATFSPSGQLLTCEGLAYEHTNGAYSFPKLCKSDNGMLLSDLFSDHQDTIGYSTLIKIADVNDLCISTAFSMTEKPDTLTYRTTNFTLQQVPVPLDIHATTRDTIDALFTSPLCKTTTVVSNINADNAFTLKPNPVTSGDIVTISLQGNLQQKWLAVIDLNGRLLEKLEVGSTNQLQLSTIGMPAGTYLVQAISQAGIKTTIKRLVVIR